MRRTLIATSLAALAMASLAGGAAFAADSDVAPEATPTTVPGSDVLADLGFTAEQTDCLVANVGTIDINDTAALNDLMAQCGVTFGVTAETTVESIEEPATTEPVDIDAATASAVLALLGLDQTAVDCLVSGSIGAPLDDAAAEQVFVGCGVGSAQVLEAIVALNTLAGATAEVDTVTDVLDSAPPVTSGNAMVDMLITQFESSGITLDAEQAQCLLDNISQLDPNDLMTSLEVFTETCGIDITQLIPDN